VAERTASRRAWWVAVAALAVAAAAAAVALGGRSERSSWVAGQVRGIGRVRQLVGPLDSRSLIGYRVLPAFDCLVYERHGNLLALELCVDRAGRVVEAADRRRPGRVYYSLRAEPTASTVRVDRGEVDRLLRMMRATT